MLLERFARGDRVAASELAARLAPPVLRFAQRMLGGDLAEAEDITQEAMLRLWRQAHHWEQGAAQPATWLYRVAANLCTDRLRQRRRRAQVPLEAASEPADPGPAAPAAMMAEQRVIALDRALAGLPARQRQALILRHIEGLGNAEISQIMETGVEAVESLTARARRGLRAALLAQRAELGFEDDEN